jgi:hypothetical protein
MLISAINLSLKKNSRETKFFYIYAVKAHRDEISCPYKTTGKHIILFNLIFTFVSRKI